MQHLLQLILQESLILSKVVKGLVWWIIVWAKILIWPWTSLGRLRERRVCPPITEPLLLMSATELAAAIRLRQVKCSVAVEAYIARVRLVNPLLNAVVQERFAEALEEAREIDDILASGRLSEERLRTELPLLGVPLTVKETIALKGMSNNGAWSIFPEHKAAEDAEVVRLLRAAGAVALLVSNTPELCLCWETFNPKVGTTNNPYDLRRTPAGSSGGEAALLGSGASVISLGSDIGGSLRLPAMFCGVYGHKPTPGFVSNSGHRPSSEDERWDHFFTLGPMCRYAVDLPLLLHTVIGDKQRAAELRLFEQVDLSRVKVYYIEEDKLDSHGFMTDPVSQDLKTAMRKAVNLLQEKHGCTVQQVTIKGGLADVLALTTFIMLRMDGIPNIYQKTEDKPNVWNNVPWTILKRLMCLSSSSATALMYGPLKNLVDSTSEYNMKRLLAKTNHLRNQFQEMLGDDGVFLYPTFPEAAHFHGQIFYKFLNTAYPCLFNLLEMPATACPLGLNSEDMPVGIQISAWRKQDRLTLAVAQALEQEFGGWLPPCSVLTPR